MKNCTAGALFLPSLSLLHLAGIVMVLAGITACTMQNTSIVTEKQATIDYDLMLTTPEQPIRFDEHVRPVLERRCVVCHGCYDAPCQLKLSSHEGLMRGASKKKVYDGARILGTEPTRLFIDAKSVAEWRDKGFHAVLAEDAHGREQQLQDSVLYRMLRLKQLHPQPRVGMLPNSFDVSLDRRQSCPTNAEFDNYEKRHPLGGMPYALPNLSDDEYRTLVQWLIQGAEEPPLPVASAEAARQIERWETFFSGKSDKQRLVSRYLYEHLFHAHIHFAGTPEREFYRLVRSTTPSGKRVDEIATIRPYDDPGNRIFYYRLSREHSSIVAKNHVVYELSDAKMQRYRELFLEPAYTVDALPSYVLTEASNPFATYDALPVNARYRFLLDNARFIIEGFIKGPVCRGQIALNVIEDNFWVVFFDPNKNLLTTNPDFLKQQEESLRLPSAEGNTLRLFSVWRRYAGLQRQYMAAKQAYFQEIHSRDLDKAMSYIWDGDGTNPNAALTIFRHFDSASVRYGFVGDAPETAWIIDYPLLERIHYLLVAGFNVFGNVGHQLNTRLYMDFLRMEGEYNFLAFLPAEKRREIRDSWYQGMRANLESHMDTRMDWLDAVLVTGYQTDDPQRELYQHMARRLGTLAGRGHDLDRCEGASCSDAEAGTITQQADMAMHTIADIRGGMLRAFPDVAFVRISTGNPDKDLAYTLIRNKAYKYVTSIFKNETVRDRRDYENDTLTVIRGLEGSYPNFFLVVRPEELPDFTNRYAAISNRDDYERFVDIYGIRRTNLAFWETADWFQQKYAHDEPQLSGLFDLNRYANR